MTLAPLDAALTQAVAEGLERCGWMCHRRRGIVVGDRCEGLGVGIDWRTRYASKVIDGPEAVGLVRDGMVVQLGPHSASPLYLGPLLARRRAEVRDVAVFADLMLWDEEWDEALAPQRRLDARTLYLNQYTRGMYDAGRLSIYPSTFYLMTRREERGWRPPDIAYLRLSEPDAEGYCSFGFAVWNCPAIVRKAGLVVAEIAPGMDRTAGDNRVHIDEVDHMVALPQDWVDPAPVVRKVVQDSGDGGGAGRPGGPRGGIGAGWGHAADRDRAAPNAVVPHLGAKRDLGYHSEMAVTGVAALHERGGVQREAQEPGRGQDAGNDVAARPGGAGNHTAALGRLACARGRLHPPSVRHRVAVADDGDQLGDDDRSEQDRSSSTAWGGTWSAARAASWSS